MRVQLNALTGFTAPSAAAPSWTAGPASRPFPQAKPGRRQPNPQPRSVPRPRPLPRPGGNR